MNRHSAAVFLHRLLAILLLGGWLLAGHAAAAPLDLLLPNGEGRFAEVSPGITPVKFNARALSLVIGDEVRVTLGGAVHTVVFDRSERHANGDETWVGHLKDHGDDYRVIVTRGAAGSFGRILTPDGEFALEPAEGGERLIDRKRAGHEIMPMGDDIHIPDVKELPVVTTPSSSVQQNTFADASTNVEIDLMILYTPGMVARYPGDALQTRLNYLVSLANQSYIDSKVGITLRLVHSERVEYSDTTINEVALTTLQKRTDPALAGVSALRAEKGADLVSLIRPYNITAGGNCGIATLGGAEGSDISRYAGLAYSVVSDGKDAGYECGEYTLAHELGHNMGCDHDLKHGGGSGAYPYSNGYGKKEVFGTIMSYINPIVGKFSNPAITCDGQPCGIVETAPDAANNALSLNNTRSAVANFMKSKEQVEAGFTINADGTVLHKTTGLIWKRCAEGQTWSGSTCSGTAMKYTWDQAMALGTSGWGLPTLEQLKSIVEEGRGFPTINTLVFPDTPAAIFWSASTDAGSSGYAWYVNFFLGGGTYGKTYSFYVRLVRGGQSLGSSSTSTDADRFFNWAESKYAELFRPAKTSTRTASGYTYRYYSDTQADLAVKDGRVYYRGGLTGGQISDVGALADFLTQAKAAGF